MKKVVIIGAGLGGLALALRLSHQGFAVTIIEKNNRVGGKLGRFSDRGFTFDTGPTLITLPEVFRQLLESVGENLDSYIKLQSLPSLGSYYFPNGKKFEFHRNIEQLNPAIAAIEPNDVEGFKKFLELGERIYSLSKSTFLKHSPYEARELLNFRVGPPPFKVLTNTYQKLVDQLFYSQELRNIFYRYPTYVGSNPYQAPAMLLVIPYIEFTFGAWHIHGGLYELALLLEKLCLARGVEIILNETVTQINTQNSRAVSVETEQASYRSDILVSNIDPLVCDTLLSRNKYAKNAQNLSLSGIVWLAGVSTQFPEFNHHTVFFSDNYKQEFSELFKSKVLPHDPTVYMSIASKTDPHLAPKGASSVFFMINAPANTKALVDEANIKKTILSKLSQFGVADIESGLVVEDFYSPKRFEVFYGAPHGSIYGLDSNSSLHAFLRPRNKDRQFSNLYFVGGGTHPGGGTPMVVISSEIVASLINKYEI